MFILDEISNKWTKLISISKKCDNDSKEIGMTYDPIMKFNNAQRDRKFDIFAYKWGT